MVVTQEELHGRSREVSSATTITLDVAQRLWFVNMTAASQQVRMPDARLLGEGGAHFVVAMRSGSSTVTIADNGGNAITTSDGTSLLEALTRGMVLLIDNSTANGIWAVKKDTIAHLQNPTPIEFLYVHGGTNTSGGAGVRSLRRYNHQLNTWLTGTSSSFDCKEGGGFRIGTVGGVWHGNNAAPRNKVQHYDPDVWATKADSPRNHEDQSTASVGVAATVGYSIGGVQSTTFKDTDEYTLSGDTWALRAALPLDLRAAGHGVSDGTYLYVLWGSKDTVTDVRRFVYRYHPTLNTYAAMATSPSLAVNDFAACAFSGFILKLCGTVPPATAQVDLYEIALNVWVRKLVFPVPATPITLIGGGMSAPESVPILCGGNAGGDSNDTWRYFRVTDVWIQKADMPAAPGFIVNQAIAATP
jgi:hypothetical protein